MEGHQLQGDGLQLQVDSDPVNLSAHGCLIAVASIVLKEQQRVAE
jgi:hypothetical protein